MVGYDEDKERRISEVWKGVAGTVSGILTRLVCQPLDVLKIRFQLQHEAIREGKETYYWGLRQASLRILKEESFTALWKGHIPAQLLTGTFGLAQFGSFELMTRIVHTVSQGDNNKAATHFLCGAMSGVVAAVFTMPFDTIRTRLVGQGEPKIYRGVSHAFSTMIQHEGFLSLYKGLVPNIMQIAPYTGMQFGLFYMFSNLYRSIFHPDPDSIDKLPSYANLASGSASGFLAKTAIYPLDLAKKRLQVQGFEVARAKFGKVKTYRGLVHCLLFTWKDEGFLGLYKGFTPSALKALVQTGLIFAIYEEIIYVLELVV